MVIKFSLLALMLLSSLVILALSMNSKSELYLNIKGNDELGIKLELPYLKESPADVLITNNGKHNLIAYKIRWEGIKYNGEVVDRFSIKCHPDVLREQSQTKRMELLSRQPLLPPNTKWLVGLGRQMRQIADKVPSLDEVGRDPQLFPDLKEYKQINVTLDGIILEDGKVVGRDPDGFTREINMFVAEYQRHVKERNK